MKKFKKIIKISAAAALLLIILYVCIMSLLFWLTSNHELLNSFTEDSSFVIKINSLPNVFSKLNEYPITEDLISVSLTKDEQQTFDEIKNNINKSYVNMLASNEVACGFSYKKNSSVKELVIVNKLNYLPYLFAPLAKLIAFPILNVSKNQDGFYVKEDNRKLFFYFMDDLVIFSTNDEALKNVISNLENEDSRDFSILSNIEDTELIEIEKKPELQFFADIATLSINKDFSNILDVLNKIPVKEISPILTNKGLKKISGSLYLNKDTIKLNTIVNANDKMMEYESIYSSKGNPLISIGNKLPSGIAMIDALNVSPSNFWKFYYQMISNYKKRTAISPNVGNYMKGFYSNGLYPFMKKAEESGYISDILSNMDNGYAFVMSTEETLIDDSITKFPSISIIMALDGNKPELVELIKEMFLAQGAQIDIELVNGHHIGKYDLPDMGIVRFLTPAFAVIDDMLVISSSYAFVLRMTEQNNIHDKDAISMKEVIQNSPNNIANGLYLGGPAMANSLSPEFIKTLLEIVNQDVNMAVIRRTKEKEFIDYLYKKGKSKNDIGEEKFQKELDRMVENELIKNKNELREKMNKIVELLNNVKFLKINLEPIRYGTVTLTLEIKFQ